MSEGWTRSWDEVIATQLLESAYAATRGGTVPRLTHYVGNLPSGGTKEQVEAAGRALTDAGMLHLNTTMGGFMASSVHPTDRGSTIVRQRSQQRTEPAARTTACREALLDWLYTEARRGEQWITINGVLRDARGHFWGDPFAQAELKAALRSLIDQELAVDRTRGWGHTLEVADITPAGEEVVDIHQGSIAAWKRAERTGGNTQIHTHFHGAFSGQFTIGDGNTQTQHNGVDIASIERVIAAVRAESEAVSPDDRAQVDTYLDTIQAEVLQEEPSADMVRVATGRLKVIADRTVSAGFAATVSTLTTLALQAVGIG